MYHDLMWIDNKNENDLLFPKLQTFFKVFYNLAIYLHCYPHYNEDDKIENIQYFYVRQYNTFKNKLYHVNTINAYINTINYCCDMRGYGGTLGHRYAALNYPLYMEMLKDKFDPTIDIAKEKNFVSILAFIRLG